MQRIEYLWDGWNIIREVVREGDSAAVTDNVWGLDLDGTIQGAGGVGGLLAVVRDDGTYLPTYDTNGNLSEYVNADDGNIAAHYEYSPFGELLFEDGELADAFTHRFSTKPYCSITKLVEYQLRKYRPEIGRWLTRDPIGEDGGLNLYLICANSIIDNVDALGHVSVPLTPPGKLPSFPDFPYQLVFSNYNPCKSGEQLALASAYHYIGLRHLFERLPWNKGDVDLFNYLEFDLDCEEGDVEGARFVEIYPDVNPFPDLYKNANVQHAPGSPSYEGSHGVVRGSMQTRVFYNWFRYFEDEPESLIEILRKTIAVCYKCRCKKESKNE